MNKPVPADLPAMPATFGTPMAAFLIVASMVGVGVLTTSGFTVYFVGSNQWMLALWVLGGVVAACGALTLCELTSALPRTGGDYVYLFEAYGPLVAFLSGWVSFVIGFAAPSASAAVGSAKYLTEPFGLDPADAITVQRGLATLLVLLFATIHATGRRSTSHVQVWVTLIKLTLLTAFVVAGLIAGRGRTANLFEDVPLSSERVVSMMYSLVFISYAYIGWNAASYLAGEFTGPQRQIPKAILFATLGVIVLYLGLNLVYALALSATEVKTIVEAPDNLLKVDAVAPIAELAARRLFGRDWSGLLSFAVGVMLLSSLSAYLLTGPRVIYAMSVAGQFPAAAGRLTVRAGTPAVATALQTMVTLAFVWVGSLASLVGYASVGLSIFSMLAVGSVYVLRWRRPDLPRPFRTPGYPVTPAVYLLVTGVLTYAAFMRQPKVSSYAVLSILAGIPVYYAWRFFRNEPELVSPNS